VLDNRLTQNNFIHGELGRTTLLSFRSYHVIKYWLKIVHMKCTKYVKIVYNLLYNDIDVNNNTRSWVLLVRELLQYLGFNHVWMQQNVGDDSMLLKDVKQRLETVLIDNWVTELNQQLERGSNRPRTYVLIHIIL